MSYFALNAGKVNRVVERGNDTVIPGDNISEDFSLNKRDTRTLEASNT
jgi:hypothetical protein